MPPSKVVTAAMRAKEFSPDLFEDHGVLMCLYCNKSISFENKAFCTSHLQSKIHKTKRAQHLKMEQSQRQQTIHSVLDSASTKKQIIDDFLEAWVSADIPLEKVDKFRGFLSKYCREGGTIPCADTLRRKHLNGIYEAHILRLKPEFANKRISIIIDETTDSCARSVVNTLFIYRGITKLISVDFLETIDNVTIGGLILRLLTQWSIPFSAPRLLISDSAAYMKKSFREVLKPVMPQIKHNACPAHIMNLIRLVIIFL